jgi:hypothetical protein
MIQLSTLLQTVAVIAACWAVISGVDAWKREFVGKRQIEVAEETLAPFFEVKDAIAFIRSPWQRQGEGSSRKRASAETAVDSDLLDRGYVVWERYEEKKDIFRVFGTQKYKFMASFGADSEDVFTRVHAQVNAVFAAATMLATHYWKRQGRVEMEKDEFARHLNEMHQHEGVFWDSSDGANDVVRKELASVQQALEEIVRPAFAERMATYTWMTTPLRNWMKGRGAKRRNAG